MITAVSFDYHTNETFHILFSIGSVAFQICDLTNCFGLVKLTEAQSKATV